MGVGHFKTGFLLILPCYIFFQLIQESFGRRAGMKEELERWKAGTMTIESSQELLDQEKLIFTIKGLNNALFAATINKEGEMVLELTKVINHLNGIKDK